MITTKNGLLYKDGKMLDTIGADEVAREHDFQWAEELVEHLDPPTKLKDYQKTLENAWNRLQCALHGHTIEDCSHAGPNSGDMDHQCTRCGQYWAVTLY